MDQPVFLSPFLRANGDKAIVSWFPPFIPRPSPLLVSAVIVPVVMATHIF